MAKFGFRFPTSVASLFLAAASVVLIFCYKFLSSVDPLISIPNVRRAETIPHNPISDTGDDSKLATSQLSPSIIKVQSIKSEIAGDVILEWDPDDILKSRQFNTDTMKQDFFMFLEVWNRRPLKSNAGGMGFHHQFMLWYSVRRVQPKLIVESGMNRGATTWLLHEAAPAAQIISFDPVAPKDWVSDITTAISFFPAFQSALHSPQPAISCLF